MSILFPAAAKRGRLFALGRGLYLCVTGRAAGLGGVLLAGQLCPGIYGKVLDRERASSASTA